MMRCVYCGTHWSPGESDYVLDTGFGIEHNEDPCFCDSLCKRHFMRILRRIGTAELSMEDLIEGAVELFDQDYIELGEDYNQLNIAGNIMKPNKLGSDWLFVGRDGQRFSFDDIYVDTVKREMVLYYNLSVVPVVLKL